MFLHQQPMWLVFLNRADLLRTKHMESEQNISLMQFLFIFEGNIQCSFQGAPTLGKYVNINVNRKVIAS